MEPGSRRGSPGFLLDPMKYSASRFGFAAFTALATLGLVCMGGLVTSKGVGMAVPDWPTSFGYNMFALPVAQWFHGGVFDEHTHRLWASTVGLLVVLLTRWLGGQESRRPLALIGAAEVVGGLCLLLLGPDWKGAGHFLAGIGGVVLLSAAIWVRVPRAEGILPQLGWAAFWLVQLQGLLGGLRVVLDKALVGNVTLGMVFGMIHGCLGQMFFVLLGVIALMCSRAWIAWSEERQVSPETSQVQPWLWAGAALVVLQLLLGAGMRHQHAGLAITDFPLAYGQIWPATDPESMLRYNQLRTHESTVTDFQIHLQMVHRIGAVMALVVILTAACQVWRRLGWDSPLGKGAAIWAGLVLMQFMLGMFTVWTNKAADVATAHVAGGALLLLVGTLLILIARKLSVPSWTAIPVEPVRAFARPAVH